MKKVAASLYMSFPDQSVKNDESGDPRRLRCSVTALGPSGPVPAKGELALRLLGEKQTSSWESSELAESVDRRGEVEFDGDAILELVDEANADGAEPELFRIEFDGGKGKKLNQITVDCIHEPVVG